MTDIYQQAAAQLRAGGIVAYPTEAVFGLGCDPLNEAAITQLLSLKQRPKHKGLILIAGALSQFGNYIDLESLPNYPAVQNSWPGPNTWLLPCLSSVPDWLTGDHDTLALRLTACKPVIALCEAFGGAIVSTSANLSGQPPALTADEVNQTLSDRIAYTVEGNTDGLTQVTPIRDARSGRQIR